MEARTNITATLDHSIGIHVTINFRHLNSKTGVFNVVITGSMKKSDLHQLEEIDETAFTELLYRLRNSLFIPPSRQRKYFAFWMKRDPSSSLAEEEGKTWDPQGKGIRFNMNPVMITMHRGKEFNPELLTSHFAIEKD